jgi:hypothetical protein
MINVPSVVMMNTLMEVPVPSVQALTFTALHAMLKTNAPDAVITSYLMLLALLAYATVLLLALTVMNV